MNGSSFMKVESREPAGWYDDPHGTGMQRWFDGTAWTQVVREVSTPRKKPGGCSCAC
ncbi:DUF2510 domain-containing protein [Microbacterium koreense]|uniref:DUF2510 domain-containing protein n=1 Tax=Microbacterium koreense TaxID=323761 RepID=A0ABW2ZPT0_9MICO